MKRILLASFAIIMLSAAPSLAQMPRERLRDRFAPPPPETLYSATVVLNELTKITAQGIPPALMADAKGVVIIPHVVKAGFVIAGSGGHGLVIAREKTGEWGKPVFLNFGGASVGLQLGVESTDVVLVFRERKSLDRLLEGKGKFTLGADASIAAGPVGRQAMAGTDGKLEAEIVSYSRSRGLFAGLALDGAVLRPDTNSNNVFTADTRPEVAKQVEGLKLVLNAMCSVTPPAQPIQIVPAPGMLLPPVTPIVPARP